MMMTQILRRLVIDAKWAMPVLIVIFLYHFAIQPIDTGDMMTDDDRDHDVSMDHMNDVPDIGGDIPFSQPLSQMTDTQFTQVEGEISHTYEGAPQEVIPAYTHFFTLSDFVYIK